MKNLKEKTIRGAVARMLAQAVNFAVRLGSLMILTRLLGPKEFGLIGMTMAFTGVLSLFRDFGLSSATVQRATITEEQLSALFWVNVSVGAALALVTAAMAPAIAAFYHQPELVGVTIVVATGFLFNAAGVQHSALLQREMRFTALSVINTVALGVSAAVGIAGAMMGYGYWALAAMTVTLPIASTLGFWFSAGWTPGKPARCGGIQAMLRFGGAMTVNSVAVYIATNVDKVFLGRVWGADVLGLYGRAYQLINIPTDNLNATAGEVAFAALSRLQDDAERMRSYFLKGYALIIALTVPITVACALFADDVVAVILGPKWKQATVIFRLLAPTILVFAIVNPLGWLLSALGRIDRLVKIAVSFAPCMILGCAIGVMYGPKGVAFAYSAVMVLWAIPVIAWAVHGTMISFGDVVATASGPLVASLAAGGIAWGIRVVTGVDALGALPRGVVDVSALFCAYAAILLSAGSQKALYLDLLRGMVLRRGAEPSVASSAVTR